jgi:hypothetical protein
MQYLENPWSPMQRQLQLEVAKLKKAPEDESSGGDAELSQTSVARKFHQTHLL